MVEQWNGWSLSGNCRVSPFGWAEAGRASANPPAALPGSRPG